MKNLEENGKYNFFNYQPDFEPVSKTLRLKIIFWPLWRVDGWVFLNWITTVLELIKIFQNYQMSFPNQPLEFSCLNNCSL
jgi:hypothetical protein